MYTYSKRAGSTQASEETEDDELILGFGSTTQSIEDDIKDIGRLKNDRSPKNLGQGSRNRRNHRGSQKKDRQ